MVLNIVKLIVLLKTENNNLLLSTTKHGASNFVSFCFECL